MLTFTIFYSAKSKQIADPWVFFLHNVNFTTTLNSSLGIKVLVYCKIQSRFVEWSIQVEPCYFMCSKRLGISTWCPGARWPGPPVKSLSRPMVPGTPRIVCHPTPKTMRQQKISHSYVTSPRRLSPSPWSTSTRTKTITFRNVLRKDNTFLTKTCYFIMFLWLSKLAL